MLTDKWLALRCRRGDREAFSLVYETYVDNLLTLAVSLLGDLGSAEDVVQDVFVNFARNAESFRLTGSLRGLPGDVYSESRPGCDPSRHRSQRGALPEADALDSGMETPSDLAARKGTARATAAGDNPFTVEQREALVLRLHGDLTFKEIAAMQGVSLKTVQSRYRYALDKLRTLLKCEGSYEAQR